MIFLDNFQLVFDNLVDIIDSICQVIDSVKANRLSLIAPVLKHSHLSHNIRGTE